MHSCFPKGSALTPIVVRPTSDKWCKILDKRFYILKQKGSRQGVEFCKRSSSATLSGSAHVALSAAQESHVHIVTDPSAYRDRFATFASWPNQTLSRITYHLIILCSNGVQLLHRAAWPSDTHSKSNSHHESCDHLSAHGRHVGEQEPRGRPVRPNEGAHRYASDAPQNEPLTGQLSRDPWHLYASSRSAARRPFRCLSSGV